MFELSNKYNDEPRTLSVGRFKVRWPFPIVQSLHSSFARVFGYPVYADERWWVDPVYCLFRAISNTKYWCKYRLFPTRYHHLDTGLPPGYHDPRSIFLYAAFAALGRYIDEKGGIEEMQEYIDDMFDMSVECDTDYAESYIQQAKTEEEALSIWLWWTDELPRMKQLRDAMMHELFGGKSRFKSVPLENTKLVEMVMEPFTETEENLHTKFRALEEKIAKDKQTMLHRLVDIRESLWT